MRLRNKPWAPKLIEDNPQIIVPNPKERKGKWSELFENDNPLHVEVGTGKGRFVTKMAASYPDRNVIGVEKYDSVIVTGVERLLENPLDNIRLLKADVTNITEIFDSGEVDRFYINFTDPWPKNRHEKRRLTHKSFLKKYSEILKDTGEIHLKTDNQGLFEYSIESLSQFGFKLKQVTFNLHESNMEDNIMTEYEERFVEKGIRIYRLEAYK
ncbi:tRNA (guanosine(46)-N7)-methyltransferase TrmB [Evansella sp. AB-P1]|uniref:tRNA (guanosine(46)-N7)-methyltransferase TrmB n=1 Tax=Evansella sp. AB-P1 TaxID=3037653 RepID=UPI00241E1178|nr:tRNA (guanosine(46)-N7)-methyltransferase TrmB [Evansella sp. AB-P1]MDG5787729.1 tRNA (guanosine(46)-N7)-methyltransferase TrmB [Evansella sp. AB-P1]